MLMHVVRRRRRKVELSIGLCAFLLFPHSVAAQQPASTFALSLDNAIALADNANIDVLRARLALKTAQANLRSADTAPNPVLSVNALQVRPSQIGSVSYPRLADTAARVDLPLERGGKRSARVGSATALINAAQGDLATARRDMRQAVFDAYFDLKAAEAKVATLQAISQSYADGLNIASTQRKAGALSTGDLARQSVEASRAKSDLIQSLTDQHSAQLALATLIGEEMESGTLVTSGDWPIATASSSEAPDALAMQRPEVLAAHARVEAARRDLVGAHALRYPDVTVGVQYERADGNLGVGNSVGVGLAVPIPVRNQYRGEVDAANVALARAEADERKTLSVATADIVIARQALAEASHRRQEFDDIQLPAARKAAEVAEFAYKNGATSLIELLDARRSLRAVELGAIDARSNQAEAIARLRAAETTGDDQ